MTKIQSPHSQQMVNKAATQTEDLENNHLHTGISQTLQEFLLSHPFVLTTISL